MKPAGRDAHQAEEPGKIRAIRAQQEAVRAARRTRSRDGIVGVRELLNVKRLPVAVPVVVLLAGLIVWFVMAGRSATPVVFVLPVGFQGPLAVLVDENGSGHPLVEVGGELRVEFPANGLLETRSEDLFHGFRAQRFVDASGSPVTDVVSGPASTSTQFKGAVIWLFRGRERDANGFFYGGGSSREAWLAARGVKVQPRSG